MERNVVQCVSNAANGTDMLREHYVCEANMAMSWASSSDIVPFSALFSTPVIQQAANQAPLPCAVLPDQAGHAVVLLRSPLLHCSFLPAAGPLLALEGHVEIARVVFEHGSSRIG